MADIVPDRRHGAHPHPRRRRPRPGADVLPRRPRRRGLPRVRRVVVRPARVRVVAAARHRRRPDGRQADGDLRAAGRSGHRRPLDDDPRPGLPRRATRRSSSAAPSSSPRRSSPTGRSARSSATRTATSSRSARRRQPGRVRRGRPRRTRMPLATAIPTRMQAAPRSPSRRQPVAEDHRRDDRRGDRGEQQRGRRPSRRDAPDRRHEQEVPRRCSTRRRWSGGPRSRPDPGPPGSTPTRVEDDGRREEERSAADEVGDRDERPIEAVGRAPPAGEHDVQPEHRGGDEGQRDTAERRGARRDGTGAAARSRRTPARTRRTSCAGRARRAAGPRTASRRRRRAVRRSR